MLVSCLPDGISSPVVYVSILVGDILHGAGDTIQAVEGILHGVEGTIHSFGDINRVN